MNDELRELIKQIIDTDDLLRNLVILNYESNEEFKETIERVSTVYEVRTMKEGFD